MSFNIEHFNGNTESWEYSSLNVLLDLRLDNHKRVSKLLNKFIKELNVECKIGNANNNISGEIFRISVIDNNEEKRYLALKILPILYEGATYDNKNEISLAYEASELVLKGESFFFPIIYNYKGTPILCKDTYFHTRNKYNLNFYNRSLEHQQYQKIITSVKKITDVEIRNQILTDVFKFKNDFHTPKSACEMIKQKYDYTIKVDLNIKVKSHIILSELCSYDLHFYLKNFPINSEEIFYLLYDIFSGIYDLHIKLNILHNELCVENILIRDGKLKIPMISDFGEAEKIDYFTASHYLRCKDILNFIESFTNTLNSSYYPEYEPLIDVRNILNQIKNITLKSYNVYPIQDVLNYFDNL
jgi:hypothetical protein